MISSVCARWPNSEIVATSTATTAMVRLTGASPSRSTAASARSRSSLSSSPADMDLPDSCCGDDRVKEEDTTEMVYEYKRGECRSLRTLGLGLADGLAELFQ